MKILLTNDDGINAPGLCAAAQGLRHLGEVFVVAPEHEHSGVGASLTLRSPLTVRRVRQGPEMLPDAGGKSPHPAFPKGELGGTWPPGGGATPSLHSDPVGTQPSREIVAYAVGGTPADSCVLALEQVVGPVDLVVSGINAGSNLGWDVMISGTVGAAIQGYVRGYPSIAISVAAVEDPRFEESAMLLALIVERLAERMVGDAQESPRFLLNINVPSVPLSEIKGIRVTRMGDRSYAESVRPDGDGEGKRYRIDRNRPVEGEAVPNTDIWALGNGLISVTPLHLNLGNHAQIPEIEYLLADILKQPVN